MRRAHLGRIALSQSATLTAPHLDETAGRVRTHLATVNDPGMATRVRRCWEHCAESSNGTIVGDDEFYERLCREQPEDLRGKESVRVLFALAGDPAGRLALLRRLVDFDLMGSVKVFGLGVDDPLLHWLGSPRGAADVATYDSLWVRLVDLPEALQARTWNAPCDVVVEVADTTAPWNDGSWRIRADDAGDATVERTTAESDVRLRVEALGGAYLGGGNLVALQRAGLVAERRKGGVAELWRAMRTEVLPTAAFGF